MMISKQRYPEISIKDILGLLRINGYLRISQDISGYLFGANSQMPVMLALNSLQPGVKLTWKYASQTGGLVHTQAGPVSQ